jgi:demethylmenaquinone methyltransferase/2-methoxy-6-polyprenyl-1,4-benzoquinol methylase
LCPPVLPPPDQNDKERHARVVRLFDAVAPYYDRMNRVMSCGTGDWYRRSALRRAGLTERMRLLDVGCGTGIVAGHAAHIVGPLGGVMALDPSIPMLRTARQQRVPCVIQGIGEFLPFADRSFDMLSMGYALRHVTDLHVTFGEYQRVLKPGG